VADDDELAVVAAEHPAAGRGHERDGDDEEK
jgi:hypothetical protein